MIKKLLLIVFLLFAGEAFAADPIIIYTDIISGPNSGGEDNKGCYLSIFGYNFGTPSANLPPATTHVYINNNEVGAYKYLGAPQSGIASAPGMSTIQQLSVQIGSSASTGAIKVTTSAGTSNTDHTFTVRSGDIYYISTSGNDSNLATYSCSYSNPCRTGNVAYDDSGFGAGDFIVFGTGNSDEQFDLANENLVGTDNEYYIFLSKAGTSGNPITLYGYPSATVPVFTADDDERYIFTGGEYVSQSSDYTVIANLKFDGNGYWGETLAWLGGSYYWSGDGGGYPHSNYNRLVNLWAYHTNKIISGAVGHSAFQWFRCSDMKAYGLNVGPQYETGDGFEGHAIYAAYDNTNLDLGWSWLHYFPDGRGVVQIRADNDSVYGTNTGLRVHHCVFEDTRQSALLVSLGTQDIVIDNNMFLNCGMSGSNFPGVALRGGASGVGSYKFFNNIVVGDSGGDGTALIQCGYSPDSCWLDDLDFRGNILYATNSSTPYAVSNSANFVFADDMDANYDTFYGYSGGTPAWAGAGSISSDPKFTSLVGDDYTLQSDSPSINISGLAADVSSYYTVDFLSLPRDANYDGGVFEYGATSGTATIPMAGGIGNAGGVTFQ